MKKIIFAREWLAAMSLLLIYSTAFASSASSDEFERKMMKVDLGMKKEDVVVLVGEPTAVDKKFINSKGKLVEVYRYPDDTEDIMKMRLNSTPYLITYESGVVEKIDRVPFQTKS